MYTARPSNAVSGAQDLQLEVYSALRKLKILFSLMQVLSQFTWNFEVPWPAEVLEIWGARRYYNCEFALLTTLALTCFLLFAATWVAARACAVTNRLGRPCELQPVFSGQLCLHG